MRLCEILNEMPRVPYNDIEDDMGAGMSRQAKYLQAKKEDEENKWRASKEVTELAHKIKNMLSQVYNTYQSPYINHKIRTVNVKVGGVKSYNFNSPAAVAMNAKLENEFKGKITVRRSGSSSVLYHIPYDIFD